ncbi:MAG TPA: Asp-tRNA(Asn)/Glu-tRNA(Gln) amidotransferase subunit GatA [Candidatus Sulfotelmatobacter sp.]|nr:Asp-tRNA(Asn)/Glu-tRNA(Gln) amidotransferase subunit GatA [Candidatus Sulfotelmatobacter sp.]
MSDWPSIADIADQVNAGKLSALDQVKKSLSTIEEKKDYCAIISTLEEPALKKAKDIDEKVSRGEKAGRLAGVPFIAKDNFLVFGAETTAASNILQGFNPPYQSSAINKLESEGAICVAKSNLDAFAHGTSTENSDFFVTKNPVDKERVPGGSSGGSAAAVTLGMAPFALGTDTGGSIRQPASFCGCVGYKPSYGLVSRSGVVAMASSTDVIGPLSTNVSDAALVLDVMGGQDPLDSTTIAREDNYTDLSLDLKTKKIGVIKEYMDEGLEEGVKSSVNQAIEKLKSAGVEVNEISIPDISLALASYYIICPAEVSSNLARYDGQRFGYSYKEAKDLEESYKMSRGRGFGKEAKRRIMIGTYVLSSGYYEAYYNRAQIVRTKLINEFTDAFKKVDLLLGPVAPTTAFKIGENINNPLKMYLCDIMTVAANMVGNPSISLPIQPADGLPVGLQLMANSAQDKMLLSAAKQVEELLK